MTLVVKCSPGLMAHLDFYVVDGATVGSSLFEGGRLTYPGRSQLEHDLGYSEPYTVWHECRVVTGFSGYARAAVRLLASWATSRHAAEDPTLDLLWQTHHAWSEDNERADGGPSLDRLVAALVAIEDLRKTEKFGDALLDHVDAADLLVSAFHYHGFPPTLDGLEELMDGAFPAAVGLGLVEVG